MPLKPEMSSELRSMVRDVLREVMASRVPQAVPSGVEQVRIASEADFAAFVARLIDPATAERVRSGKLRFTLGALGTAVPAAPLPSGPALTGVITEQKIDRLAGTGTLVLGPDAVLTPLARDRARRLGLKIERRR